MIYNGKPSKMTEHIRNTLVFFFLNISSLQLTRVLVRPNDSQANNFSKYKH